MAEAVPGGIAFDTTVPVTQASADAAAVGVAAAAARRDHRHGMPTIGAAPGVTYAGGNTTEATTTSTTAVDLLTVTGLSILAATPFLFVGGGRKTSGAADFAGLGFKINTTVIALPRDTWSTTATNEAQNGSYFQFITPRVTNYLLGGAGFYGVTGATDSNAGTTFLGAGANMPSVTITDVVIRALVVNALITIGADELHIYTLATS